MSSVPTASRPLIVYVDDERANRIVLEAAMKAEFNLKTADGGEQALELLAAHDVAVVLTDMRMPGMTGDQLLRIVKERYPQVIRMVMTAHQDIGPILNAINEGLVARYIVKPWDRVELGQVLQWACEAWVFGRESAALHRRLMDTERLATLGSIAGLLVHDLRQPLMSQLVNIEQIGEIAQEVPTIRAALAQADLPAATRDNLMVLLEDLPATVADLKEATTHLSNMISGLRDLGKPRKTDLPAELPAIDPLPIVKHAIGVCHELALKSRATIAYEGPTVLPHVRMSHTELMQVMINVVANAGQAVAARGEPGGRVSVIARRDPQHLELRVRDTGVGMSAETLRKVGTPFFTTRNEGTGLGVAQCQRLIGAVGGRFLIESELGKGMTVTITLPIAT